MTVSLTGVRSDRINMKNYLQILPKSMKTKRSVNKHLKILRKKCFPNKTGEDGSFLKTSTALFSLLKSNSMDFLKERSNSMKRKLS